MILLRVKAVPSNAPFYKQLISMVIPKVLRGFLSSSLTVPKAPVRTGIIVPLTFYNFCTWNIKSWYLVIFYSLTLMFSSPGTAMLMILHSLLSLSITTTLAFHVPFPYLSGSQSPKVFYISHSLALSDDVRTICLYIQFQISCTGASARFPKFVVSLSILVFS